MTPKEQDEIILSAQGKSYSELLICVANKIKQERIDTLNVVISKIEEARYMKQYSDLKQAEIIKLIEDMKLEKPYKGEVK